LVVVIPPSPPDLRLGDGWANDVRETHISWVFLTDARAYKVKKPVVLPFLDYGSAERRRDMCRAEVALNRRLAPDVYIGVRSLVPAAGGGLRLGEEDDPGAVDFAVEMRRYSEADTLAARLAAGTAGPPELAAVGERLAAFHAAADPDLRPDGAEAVKRALDDNFASLRTLTADGGERGAVARAERSAAAFLTAAWDELDERSRSGRVRECHGDLRLEHVLLGREVEVVDCIEFNPELRTIDVAADLAFLVMELREARRDDLAGVLMSSYRAAGGDVGSDALIAFFAAYRAEVRAKVALMRAGQLSRGDRFSRERAHESELLALATRLRWASRAPLVVVLAGLSASGKTTVATALAAASGFGHVNSDVVRKRMAGVAPTERATEREYTDSMSRATYAELGRLAAAGAAEGVIVDATFRRRADRDAFRAALGGGVNVLFGECRAPDAVLEARAIARDGDPGRVSDAGPDIVRRQRLDAEPLDEIEARDHVLLRSDRPVAEILAELADALDRRAAGSVVRHAKIRDIPAVAGAPDGPS
jgi:aminoglycoside phosphotransferase family enzyme/predicted kinase